MACGGFIVLGASVAQAGGVSVDLLGLLSYSMATGSPTTPTAGLGIPGGGMVLNFHLGNRVKFELGGFYETRFQNISGVDLTSRMIDGIAGLKFVVTRGIFLDAGAYANYFLTDAVGYSTTYEYGVYGGAGFQIPLGGSTALTLQGQYHYGLSQMSYNAGAGSITPTEVLGMAGLSFGMKGRSQ